MAPALEVAKLLLQLAAQDEESEPMTQMRLHKLLYYVQGWSLGVRGVPMFAEAIEAWVHGPVVKPIRSSFRDFGHGPIPIDALGKDSPQLTVADCTLVESVWRGYSQFSAAGLRRMTHAERPWLEARHDCEPGERSNNEIEQSTMKEFFREQHRLGLSYEFDADALALADHQHETGETFGLDEFRELLAR